MRTIIGTQRLMAMTITKNMRVSELADLLSKVCSDYKRCNISDERLQQLMGQLEGYSGRLSAALRWRRQRYSLKTLDKKRLERAVALGQYAKAYVRSDDEAIRAHWKAVEAVVNEYLPVVINSNMKTRTASATTMLNKLATPEMASHIAALPGLQGALDSFKTAHDAFVNQSIDNDEMKLDDNGETATYLKGLVIPFVTDELMVHLRAQCNVNAEAYSDFVQMLGNNIAEYNALVRSRRRKKATPSAEVQDEA